MRSMNTTDRLFFILGHIWWGFIAGLWYYNLLFRCIKSCSLRESRIILVVTVALTSAVLMLTEMKRYRNDTSIALNLMAGYGIYTILSYLDTNRLFIMIVMAISGAFSAGFFILIMCRKINSTYSKRRVLKHRFIKAFSACRHVMCTGLLFLMIFTGINSFFNIPFLSPGYLTAKQAAEPEQTIDNNMDTLILLKYENWKELSEDEKLSVLQTVANIERRYLGLPHELIVNVANTKDSLLGYYSDNTHEITVNREHLVNDSSFSLVNTIAHEAYHALQYRMVDAYDEAAEDSKDLLLFYEASIYKEEFKHYTDGSEDFCHYYSQQCESDARKYAKNAVYEYYERIAEQTGDYAPMEIDY
ncbi:MAG: hypothetical protein K6G22_11580 [Lachnospiraceae bacterium]|nr:hypothetical protein [Lachnospiraceae bacterium]